MHRTSFVSACTSHSDFRDLQIADEEAGSVRSEDDAVISILTHEDPRQDQTNQQACSDQEIEDEVERRPCETACLTAAFLLVGE